METTILIVDDEHGVLSAIKRALSDEPYNILTSTSGIEGLRILKENKIKLVISDERMPGMSGSDFLASVKTLFPETVRIMLTGHASIAAAMKAINSGEIFRFFSKPWDDTELKHAIKTAIDKYGLEEENRQLLKTVKRQASELKKLEKIHPGITSLKKDSQGHFVLPDISDSDTEISKLMAESEAFENLK